MQLPSVPWSMNATLFVVALVLGGAAFWGITQHVEQRVSAEKQQLQRRYASRAVLVAAQDVKAGTVLQASALAVRQMPRAFVSSNALDPAQRDVLLGGSLVRTLRSGDPITVADLLPSDALPLSAQIAPGERAITIPADEISSVGGLVQPGDRVDLFYGYEQPMENVVRYGSRAAIRLLLPDVAVLATGKATRTTQVRTDDGRLHDVDTNYSTVTLRVTPAQAQLVALAQRTGDVVAALRHHDDGGLLALPTLDWRSLLVEHGVEAKGYGRLRSDDRLANQSVELILGGLGGPVAIRRLPILRSAR